MCALAVRGSRHVPDLKTSPRARDRTPLLSRWEEVELAAGIAAGDTLARERMIRANLRLVVKIARFYLGRGLDFDDLVGEGDIGLITAVERFDVRFNVRFSTYASLWIKQAIGRALGDTGAMIRLPMHVVQMLRRWRRTEASLGQSLGREPRFDEIAEAMGLSDEHRRIMDKALRTRHQSDPGELTPDPAARRAEPQADLEQAEQWTDLRHRLGRLNAIERSVITLRFALAGGEPMTLKEVGCRLGYTREWIRKLEDRAVEKLRR